ncbi:MAG: TRAPP subunit [Thelocarpon superellum]|nr:MAG: TRAPP subunit [Thelocarpon superellum]
MSYYFAIVGTKDNPLFEHEFGTSKQGGDGIARFPEAARHMNQFIVHSSLDMVEEIQWAAGAMYLKVVDRFYNNYISCFLTGGNVKFLLLHAPSAPLASTASPSASTLPPSGSGASGTNASISSLPAAAAPPSRSSTSIAANPTSPATEEAIRQFFSDVFEIWVKTTMNPFYDPNMPVTSNVFRARIAAAGKKYL